MYHTVCRNAGFDFLDQIISLLNLGPLSAKALGMKNGNVCAVLNSLLHRSFSVHQDNQFILNSCSALIGACSLDTMPYCHRLPNEEHGIY